MLDLGVEFCELIAERLGCLAATLLDARSIDLTLVLQQIDEYHRLV